MVRTIFIMPLFLLSSYAVSAVYYVSSSGGSDSATVTQAQSQSTPWKTLTKINSRSFSAGDRILFKCGDIWEGTLTVSSSGATGNPITYGAYGTGENPKIKGTIALSPSWTKGAGSMYQADVPQNIDQLFFDGRPLTLARYPDSGYLTIDDTLGPTTLKCGKLNAADWTSAMVHVRTAHWTLASKRVVSTGVAQKTLTLQAVPVYGLSPGWGFFINNSLQALDAAGEWFYDSTARKLYLWTPGGDSPAGHTVEGSTVQNGIVINGKSFVTITGFSIAGYSQNGIYATNSSSITIDGNTISHADAIGVWFNGSSSNNVILNNAIEFSNRFGILSYGASLVCSGNTIRSIALIRDLSKYGMGDECCSGLAIEGHGNDLKIRNNSIDSIGYIGIRTSDMNNLIENNFIRHACVSKDDGAGIYSGWQDDRVKPGSAGTIIRRNIVLSTCSSPEGTPGAGYTPGEGIYLDDHGHDITIIENTVADCANHGIFIHNNKNARITGNVSYNNKEQMGLAEDKIIGPGYVDSNTVSGNVFYSLDEPQPCMTTSSPYTNTFLARSDSNYYCNPYSDIVMLYNSTTYSLVSWQRAKGLDANSKTCRESIFPYLITDTSGTNLVANGDFTGTISQWSYWPSPVKLSWENSTIMDGGCMKVLYTDDSQAASCLVYPVSFSVKKGQAYLLQFSAISNKTGILSVVLRMAHAPWQNLAMSKSFSLENRRKEYSTVFFPDSTDAQARIDFSNTKADSLYWIDNVRLIPVTVTGIDRREKSKLFFNPTLQSQVVGLSGRRYRDLDGNLVEGTITLAPFMSRILVLDTGTFAKARPLIVRSGNPALSIARRAGGRQIVVTIAFEQREKLVLSLFNFSGKRIAVLFDGTAGKGTLVFNWRTMAGKGAAPAMAGYILSARFGKTECFAKLIKIQ